MVLKIEKDHQRFRQIVKGRIRDDLRKFLTKGELIGVLYLWIIDPRYGLETRDKPVARYDRIGCT